MIQDSYAHRPATAAKLTYRYLWKLPEDSNRHELIDGVHYVTPAPVPGHQLVLGNLHFLIRKHLEAHPAGQILLAPVAVVLTLFDAVQPDLLYLSNERANRVTPTFLRGAPDLVIEILSPSTAQRDESLKLDLYSRHDVVEVLGRRSGEADDPRLPPTCEETGKARELPTARTTALTSPLFPGMSLPLGKIFEV